MPRNRCGSVAHALLLLAIVAISSLAHGGTCDRMQVNFKAGQLAIQSSGCSLQQVLEAVQEKTGIEMEMPALASTVRITVELEAGEPTAVLASLLGGTRFNYVIVPGSQGSLPTQVILTEVPAAAAATAPVDSAPKVESTPAVALAPKEPAKPKKAKTKEKKAEDQVAAAEDDGGQPKPELDDSTLKKLPQLPAGIPAAMWKLYPDIVQNGGVVPQGPPVLPGQVTPAPAGQPAQSFYFEDPVVAKGVVGLPTLPPEIDPNMGKLYPWNLMQTIQGPIIYPPIKLPPLAPPIGVH